MPADRTPDPLTQLAPVQLDRAAPGWERSRERILADITASPAPRPHSRVWLVALAAALALVAAVAIPELLGRSTSPQLAHPAPASSGDGAGLVLSPTTRAVTRATLLEDTRSSGGTDGIVLCWAVTASMPPHCGGPSTVGLTWQMLTDAGITPENAHGVTWADAALVGTWDGTRFHVEQVFKADDPAAPKGVLQPTTPPTLGALCTPPGASPSPTPGARAAGAKAAEGLPDFQAQWTTGTTLNVLVNSDTAAAENAIRAVYAGPLCLKHGSGPTASEIAKAQQALGAQFAEVPSLSGTYAETSTSGLALVVELTALDATAEQRVRQIVGPAVSPHLVWFPHIQPVA